MTTQQQQTTTSNGNKPISVEFLTEERIKLLDKIGFKWNLKETVSWEDRIEECILCKRVHGHLNVPLPSNNETPRERSFRTWANRLRGDYRKVQNGGKGRGGFDASRIKLLEQLGFVWTTPERTTYPSNRSNDTPQPKKKRTRASSRATKHYQTDSDDDDDDDDDERQKAATAKTILVMVVTMKMNVYSFPTTSQ